MSAHSVFPAGHIITTRDYRKPVKARHSRNVGPYMWTVPDSSKRSEGRGFYLASRGDAVDLTGSTFRLRLHKANEYLSGRLGETHGYYCDEHEDQTLQPIIARLNRRRGFFAGWTMGNGMASNLDTTTIYDDPADAARAAHDMAERDAETERDYQTRESARIEEEERAEALKADPRAIAAALMEAAPVDYDEIVTGVEADTLREVAILLHGDAFKVVTLAAYLTTRAYPMPHARAVKDASRAAVALARSLGYSYPKSHAISF